MLIMSVHQVPSLTQDKYEEVVRRLTNGKRRVAAPSDLPVEACWCIWPDKPPTASALSTSGSPRRRSAASARQSARSPKRSVSKSHRSSSRPTPLFRLDLPAQPATALREGS